MPSQVAWERSKNWLPQFWLHTLFFLLGWFLSESDWESDLNKDLLECSGCNLTCRSLALSSVIEYWVKELNGTVISVQGRGQGCLCFWRDCIILFFLSFFFFSFGHSLSHFRPLMYMYNHTLHLCFEFGVSSYASYYWDDQMSCIWGSVQVLFKHASYFNMQHFNFPQIVYKLVHHYFFHLK